MLHNRAGEQKLLRLFGHFSLLLIVSLSTLTAGSFEDFKRSEVESFKKFKDENDKTFNKYLQEEFKAYKAQQGISLYEEPKPSEFPSASPQEIQSIGPKTTIKVKTVQKPKQIQEDLKKKKDVTFSFYGSDLGFSIPKGIINAKFQPKNQKGITSFFQVAATSDYDILIDEIKSTSNNLNLNDWGVYLLVLKVSEHIFSDKNDSKLLSWFIFNKLGFAVKVGLQDANIVLMHYSKKTIYATPSYTFSNKKFYLISNYNKNSNGLVYSYKQDYPKSTKPLDLSLKTLPNFNSNMKSKTLKFKQLSNIYDFEYEYNQNLIDFMGSYPQADYETYFNAPLDDQTYKAIATSMKRYIDGKKASEAMNFVLNFVQSAFIYERDDQQFGREKVMFAQETLFFDKSDCEDRAVLYSYLIKELFGISVIGLKYKDHMATALYIPMQGDSVDVGNKKFIIADPTYINASIGQSMPKYRSLKPLSIVKVANN